MQEEYETVAREGEHETEVKGSRFLCLLAPAADEARARQVIAGVRAAHPSANHHCWAYVLGADSAVQRSSDDGEPGGTAGLPMLQMLSRRGVRCAVAVVTRYFGGTRLGAGGLARAYGGAVGEALDVLGTVTRQRLRLIRVTTDHQRAGRLENDLRAAGRDVREVRYGNEVDIEVALPARDVDSFGAWLADVTSGTAVLVLGEDTYGTAAGG